MELPELIEELKKIVSGGVKKGDIEKAVGMGKNSISGILNGYRPVGKIRFLRLLKYVQDSKKKRVVLVEDEAGGWVTMDGRKCRLEWADAIPKKEPECVQGVDTFAAPDREEVKRQIADIRTEKIPKERDTPMGRKIWQADQNKRIQDLQKSLL